MLHFPLETYTYSVDRQVYLKCGFSFFTFGGVDVNINIVFSLDYVIQELNL